MVRLHPHRSVRNRPTGQQSGRCEDARDPLWCNRVPGIGSCGMLTPHRYYQVEKEEHLTCDEYEAAYTSYEIQRTPPCIRGISVDTAGHFVKEEHREVEYVETYERSNKVHLAPEFAVHVVRHLWKPVVSRGEQPEYGRPRHHVVKVGDNKVCSPEVYGKDK